MSYKIGDVVPWPKVPSGALVETSGGGRFILRIGDRRLMAKVPGDDTWGTDTWGPWNDGFATFGTIVALGLTGDESADDLRRLAEVFEAREALVGLALPVAVFDWQCRDALRAEQGMSPDGLYNATRPCGTTICGVESANWPRSEMWHMRHCGACRGDVAERLHAVGWRAGMTAAAAARLLAGET